MRPGMSVRGVAIVAGTLLATMWLGGAHAVIITEWEYTFRAGFDNFAPEASPGSPFAVQGDTIGTLGLPTRIRWGQTNAGSSVIDPDAQSQLVVTDPVSGPPPQLLTNGPFIPSAELTYRNNAVFAFEDSLITTDLLTNVTLTPIQPVAGDPATAPTLTHLIQLRGTTNADNECPVDSPASSCGDILVLLNPEDLVIPIPGAIFGATFADTNYFALFTIEGLGALTADQCRAAGASPGCTGLTTQEGQDNTMAAFFAIRASLSIPEPSSTILSITALMLLLALRYTSSRATSRKVMP
jgi:hypothetical protein